MHPDAPATGANSVAAAAQHLGLYTLAPEDPNDRATVGALRELNADVFVLAGYGKILRQDVLDVPRMMSINLHAGHLPTHRGSSPLNWVLLNGETSFTLSVIRLSAEVDGGDVLQDRTFNIGPDDTIRDLHAIANEVFPKMLLDVLGQIRDGSLTPHPQDPAQVAYYPLRFPADGLIVWDLLDAAQIHNSIRALTEPYPCAYTYYGNRKVKLISSSLPDRDCFGEPGRVYRKSGGRLLVCARDKCLWINEAVCEGDGTPLFDVIQRYDELATVRHAVRQHYESVC